MAAPENNEFWKLRSKHGRDKIFKTPEILLQACYEFFEHIENEERWNEQNWVGKNGDEVTKKHPTPFTLKRLCIFLGVNSVYFQQFEESLKGKNDDISKGFSNVITHVKEIIEVQKFEGAANGFFNSNIIARDLGLKDLQEINNINEKITEVKIIRSNDDR